MKRTSLLILLPIFSLLLVNCKKENEKEDFSVLTTSYFNDKNALDPLSATQNGQNQYNDQLQFEMTESFRKDQLTFFNKYIFQPT